MKIFSPSPSREHTCPRDSAELLELNLIARRLRSAGRIRASINTLTIAEIMEKIKPFSHCRSKSGPLPGRICVNPRKQEGILKGLAP